MRESEQVGASLFARVLARTGGLIASRYGAVTIGWTLLLSLLPVVGAIVMALMSNLFGFFSVILVIPFVVLFFVGLAILWGGIMRNAAARLGGEQRKLRIDLGRVGDVGFPLLGLMLVQVLAITFGLALLVIPGLVVMTLWAVAAPAFILERRSIGSSLRRSLELTAGHRLQVLAVGLTLVGALVLLALPEFATAVSGGYGSAGFMMGLFSWVERSVSLVVNAFGAAALFVELKALKEGGESDTAELFA